MVRSDHWSFDQDLEGVRSHRRSIAAAQADRTSHVRRLARMNKYLAFLHRIGHESHSRYLPATRCHEDFFIGGNTQVFRVRRVEFHQAQEAARNSTFEACLLHFGRMILGACFRPDVLDPRLTLKISLGTGSTGFVRQSLPPMANIHVWSNFEFVADNGSIYEVDMLCVGPWGAFLVEIKSRPGTISGNAGLWSWHRDRVGCRAEYPPAGSSITRNQTGPADDLIDGCEGPQPSKVWNDYRSLVHRSWRASGPSAPCWTMQASFCRNEACAPMLGLYWVPRLRGTAALRVRSDDRSLVHRSWRASGPSAPCWTMQALFCRNKACA